MVSSSRFAEADANKVNQLYGGIAVLKAYFDQERLRNPSTLILTAGDAFGGTPRTTSTTSSPSRPELPRGRGRHTCTTTGSDSGKCQKNEVVADPAGVALVKTYLDQLATKFDVKIGTTADAHHRAVERAT